MKPRRYRRHLQTMIGAVLFLLLSATTLFGQSFGFMPELLPEPFGGVIFVQRTVTGPLDLDRDRRIDVVLSTEVARGSRSGTRRYLAPSTGTRFVGSGIATNRPVSPFFDPPGRPMTETRDAELGLVIDPLNPPPLPTNGWFRIDDNISDDTGRTNWGLIRQQFHLGLLVQRDDGVHSGWLRMDKSAAGTWGIQAFALHPQPGQPLAVGENPPPTLPVLVEWMPNYTRLTVSNDTTTRLIVLGVHRWTNHADHSHGQVVDLRGQDDWLWTTPSGDTNTLLSLEPRTRLDVLPPGGIQTRSRLGLIVLSMATGADGLVEERGPLANQPSGYFGFKGSGFGGWIHLVRDTWVARISTSATVVNGPSLASGPGNSGSAQNVDLNNDGWIDFVLMNEEFINSDFSRTDRYFHPLSDCALFIPSGGDDTPYTPIGSTLVIDPAGTWSTNRTTLEFSWRSGFVASDRGGAYLENGYMGVRFTGRDGIHYGWLRWNAGSLQFGPAASAVNPWPGEPVTVGQPAPGSLRIRRTANALAAYWPMGTTGVLERRPAVEGGSMNQGWTPVTSSAANEHVEASLEGALFRFRPTP
jgi:hypothetical protein